MTKGRAARHIAGCAASIAVALVSIYGSHALATAIQPPPTPKPSVGAPVSDLPSRATTQPSSFQFDIEELTVKFADRVVLHDQFQLARRTLRPLEVGGQRLNLTANEGPPYTIEFGRITPANIRGGALHVDQNSTTNLWVASTGPFARQLHRHDVYVSLVTLPVRVTGPQTFVAREAMPLEFSVRLRSPRFVGFEKLKIGLLDTAQFKNVASVAIGRLALPFPPIGGGGGGGGKTIDILDKVSDPAVLLNRVEEPDILGETVLDHTTLGAGAVDSAELTLRIEANGQLGGSARLLRGGQTQDISLTPKAEQPSAREFFERRSRLAPDIQLAATLYIETLPKAAVFRVQPAQVRQAEAEKVQLRIEGIGFGPDTRIEMIPSNRAAQPSVQNLALQRQNGGPEGTILLADVGLRAPARTTYSLRLTTGGQSVVVRNAVRVF